MIDGTGGIVKSDNLEIARILCISNPKSEISEWTIQAEWTNRNFPCKQFDGIGRTARSRNIQAFEIRMGADTIRGSAG
jgi:hypothetical protein